MIHTCLVLSFFLSTMLLLTEDGWVSKIMKKKNSTILTTVYVIDMVQYKAANN